MALSKNASYIPLLFTYQDTSFYLNITSAGCTLYQDNSSMPIYQLQEPVLMINGIATSLQQIHLAYLKTNGDLCYSLVSRTGTKQTTILTTLNVRNTRYRRLIILPLGKMVHIFYAYAHQAIPDLWRIEHYFWNGIAWRSVHIGEVVHPKDPLYSVSLDSQNNIHLLMMTFQGRQSLVLTNRFHGTFNLWGTSSSALTLPYEANDMATIITPANVQHLFWVSKINTGQFELNWAYRPNAHELASAWHRHSSSLRAFNGPWRGIGVYESNGNLWLLANAEQTHLFQYKGDSWKLILSQPAMNTPLQMVRKNETTSYLTYWLEDNQLAKAPAFHHQLGLAIGARRTLEQPPASPPVETMQLTSPLISSTMLLAPNPGGSEMSNPVQVNFSAATESSVDHTITSSTPTSPQQETSPPPHGPSENIPMPISASPNQAPPVLVREDIVAVLDPIIQSVENLEKEYHTLTQALEAMLSKHMQTESSLQKIEQQISNLQCAKESTGEKGFWRKWFK